MGIDRPPLLSTLLFTNFSTHHKPTSSMVRSSSALFGVAAVLAVACCSLMPATVSGSRHIKKSSGSHFIVKGRVFCDTCQAGFETPASTYIAGAKVRVECKSRDTGAETCKFEGVTDKTGTYKILVADEHEHENCAAVLVESPERTCSKMVDGRERAPVFLTRNNGIASDFRLANAMGFAKVTPLAFCASLMKQYEEVEV